MAGAFLANVAANLVAKLGEYLFAPIGRQFGYVLLHKSYVEDLENGVAELEMARERVQGSVNEAVYDGKVVHTDVRDWLDSAKEEAEEAENLLKRDKSAKYACFHGWLPNPLARHAIGEKVKKMTQVIRGLYEKSRNSNFQKVYHENTPIGIVTAATSTARSVDNKEDVLESRAKIMEDVMKAVVDDKVCVIGVYGLGGVGKSKLLEDIERRVKEEKFFDVVVMANVSRNPNIKEIQGEIAYALGLKLTNDEPVRRRADHLSKRLESDSEKKILIILDNLWKKLELKEVGIPCVDDNKVRGCKLLLTSRYRDVLCLDMGSDRQFRVNELEDGEARKLFERTVGERINDLEVRCFIDGVVQKCGGLPLLIIPVAKRLKHGDLAEWRNALTNIEGSDVKSIVELSYNDLKDERIKSLFKIFALASGRIAFGDSLMYCIGLDLFKKFSKTIQNAIDRLQEDLRILQDSSLLLYSDDPTEIKMHDIFVDKGISIASMEWNALVARKDYGFKDWSKDELTKCTAISIPFVGIDKLPEKIGLPKLKNASII
ncbi:putative disease resistance protein At3g15700 isoform X2 [Eucalyptus grandis]|uniref:putative disease resistance protein At3g15700 isoform X2 n=1 Tax=Eucalyptus grandis TaxID=71139 RepID=UPI00192ED8E3|nr:putative disease resistance protein At3g15700 isoform X2 [Eucalyptus grandis]